MTKYMKETTLLRLDLARITARIVEALRQSSKKDNEIRKLKKELRRW